MLQNEVNHEEPAKDRDGGVGWGSPFAAAREVAERLASDAADLAGDLDYMKIGDRPTTRLA